jgi:hypothetical protein
MMTLKVIVVGWVSSMNLSPKALANFSLIFFQKCQHNTVGEKCDTWCQRYKTLFFVNTDIDAKYARVFVLSWPFLPVDNVIKLFTTVSYAFS